MDRPTIEDAKRIAYAYRKKGIAIFWFDGDQFGYASYGMTREMCKSMARFSDEVYNLVGKGEIPLTSE
jgi:hypothetical protein